MQTYDKNANVRMGEDIRRQIGEVDAEIERLLACKEEIKAAHDALATLEAVLRRMSMLAREAARPGEKRPGLLLEFERCRQLVKELSSLTVVGDRNILEENLSFDDMLDLLEREPG